MVDVEDRMGSKLTHRAAPRCGENDRALDLWLRRDLAHRYSGTLSEPIPADMVILIEAALRP